MKALRRRVEIPTALLPDEGELGWRIVPIDTPWVREGDRIVAVFDMETGPRIELVRPPLPARLWRSFTWPYHHAMPRLLGVLLNGLIAAVNAVVVVRLWWPGSVVNILTGLWSASMAVACARAWLYARRHGAT